MHSTVQILDKGEVSCMDAISKLNSRYFQRDSSSDEFLIEYVANGLIGRRFANCRAPVLVQNRERHGLETNVVPCRFSREWHGRRPVFFATVPFSMRPPAGDGTAAVGTGHVPVRASTKRRSVRVTGAHKEA